MTNSECIKKIQAVCNRYVEFLAAAYLFGSAASDEATAGSDIDIALLLKPHAVSQQARLRFRLYAEFSRVLRRNDIDLVILNVSKNLILQDEIMRKGLLVYEADTDTREAYECRVLHMGIDFREQRRAVMGV